MLAVKPGTGGSVISNGLVGDCIGALGTSHAFLGTLSLHQVINENGYSRG